MKKQNELLKVNQNQKKKQNEIELAETTKRHHDLEKNNTLLSVQLQSLKFDIDQLNGAVAVMKNASEANRDKKQSINRTSVAKILSKTGYMN